MAQGEFQMRYEDDELFRGIVAEIAKNYDPDDEGPYYCQIECCADSSAAEESVGGGKVDWDDIKELRATGETFQQKLARFMREKGIKPSDAYNKIGMTRQQYSKISRVRGASHPGKGAVLGLALAMRLSLAEAREFVESANYAFMNSDTRDIAVQYLLRRKFYDIPTILINFHALGFEPFIPQSEDRRRKKSPAS